jgi:hypothetical protein
MGYALYISFQRAVPGAKGSEMSGKILAANLEKLDKAAKKLGLTTLSELVSVSDEDVDNLIGEDLKSSEAVDDFVAGVEKELAELGLDKEMDLAELKESLGGINAARPAEERWFPAATGLRSVRGLIAFVEKNRRQFANADLLLEDLRDLETNLAKAEKHAVGFHLTPDF